MESDKESGKLDYKIFLSESKCRKKDGSPNLRYRINYWCVTNKFGQFLATGGNSLSLLPSLIILLCTKPSRTAYQQASFWIMFSLFIFAWLCLIFFSVYVQIIPVNKNGCVIDSIGAFLRAFIWGLLPFVVVILLH